MFKFSAAPRVPAGVEVVWTWYWIGESAEVRREFRPPVVEVASDVEDERGSWLAPGEASKVFSWEEISARQECSPLSSAAANLSVRHFLF